MSEAPSPAAVPACLNCGTPLAGAYCHVCGQRADTERITTKRLWGQIFEAFTDLDRGFLYTLKVLTVAPGRAIKDYLAGHRAPMYNPFRFYILVAAINLIALGFLDVDFVEAGRELNQSMGGPNQRTEAIELQEKVNRWTQDNLQTIQLLALPLIAFGTWFAFRKRLGYNYAEALVLQCYTSGYSSFVMAIVIPLFGLAANPMVAYSLTGLLVSLLLSMRFMAQLEGQWSVGVVWRTVLAMIAYMLLYLVIIFVTSAVVVIVLLASRG